LTMGALLGWVVMGSFRQFEDVCFTIQAKW